MSHSGISFPDELLVVFCVKYIHQSVDHVQVLMGRFPSLCVRHWCNVYDSSVCWCWWTVHWTGLACYKFTSTPRKTFWLRSTRAPGFLARLTASVDSWVRLL